MNRQDAKKRIDELKQQIRQHDRLYYVEAMPEISDQEYDRLFAELRNLEEKHPNLLTPDSPTQRVGGEPLTALEQARHERPMLSLDNTYSLDELKAWYEKVVRQLEAQPAALSAELKVDGVSISLIYEKGQFVRAVTRGDGAVGDIVTANARTIRQLPLSLDDSPRLLEVRGEVYMSRGVFEAINQRRKADGDPEFANPRNATAGSIRLLDPRITGARRLSLWCYQVARVDGAEVTSHFESLELIRRLGFPVMPWVRRCADLAEVEQFISEWEKKRAELDFEIDGVVIKIDHFSQQQQLGATGRAVRWAVAFKYPPEGRVTKVLDIVTQVGRTGVLTPVAELEPVQLSGSTVSRATLHNFDEIERLDVRVGDTVWVTKGGEVIPKIIGVVPSQRPRGAEPFKAPVSCPVCGNDVESEPEEVALRCVNPRCTAIVAAKLRHFVGRGAMDIDGLGGRLLDQLIEVGWIEDFASLWELDKDQLAELPGWGEKSASRLLEQLEEAKTRTLDCLLFGLGIPHVGERAARLVAGFFGSLENLAAADEEQIAQLEGLGPIVAASIVNWFAAEFNKTQLDRLVSLGVAPQAVMLEATADGPLTGETVVITGTLSLPRSEIARRLEGLGAKITGSVSRKTTLLVAGEQAGSKMAKAEGLGIKIVDEKALMKILGDRGEEHEWQR